MIKRILYYGSMILVGLSVGAGSVVALTSISVVQGGIENGPWRTNALYGSADAGPYLRTGVAITGLFALRKEETIYYMASTDSDGDLLDANCRYRLKGVPPEARWWSFTLYAADHFLVDNPDGIYSVAKTGALLGPGGNLEIVVSPDRQDGNWLPSTGAGPLFSITARLYHPAAGVYADLAGTPLPTIRKEGCL